jgi:hypothetical protein
LDLMAISNIFFVFDLFCNLHPEEIGLDGRGITVIFSFVCGGDWPEWKNFKFFMTIWNIF